MNLTDTFSGTEPPINILGVENSTYHQIQTDGRITVWVKRSGRWTISSDVGSSSSLAGNKLNQYWSSITLTNAQIKALPSTGIEVIAAQGDNTIIIPTLGFLHLNWVADYDNIGDQSAIKLSYGGGGGTPIASLQEASNGQVSNLLIDGASHAAYMPMNGFCKDNLNLSGIGQFDDDPGPINSLIKIAATNAGSHTGNFTAGDNGNTMTVSIAYLVSNILTGAFL